MKAKQKNVSLGGSLLVLFNLGAAARISLAGLKSTVTSLPYAKYKAEELDSLLSIILNGIIYHEWHISITLEPQRATNH